MGEGRVVIGPWLVVIGHWYDWIVVRSPNNDANTNVRGTCWPAGASDN
jgi:hypothetical protein